MAKILRDLLEAEEPLFSLSLRQLEKASGLLGRDVQLIGEIAQKVRTATQALGLDPSDTTGPELYAAVQARIQRDNARVARLIGGSNPDDMAAMAPLAIRVVQKLDIPKTAWLLKRSVAKKLLKSMPPKRLMKQLGYRSVDSMLKHEQLDELYCAIRFAETPAWLDAYNEQLRSIRPSDFEIREIRFLLMDEKYASLAKNYVREHGHAVVYTKEMGTVGVVPVGANKTQGMALRTLSLLVHYCNEIRVYSAFFKLKQVAPDFGETVVRTLKNDASDATVMAGQHVHWRVVHGYYGSREGFVHPELFEPHLQPDDLEWRRTETVLAMIDPDMAFWQGLDYVGRSYDGQVYTFNLLDALTNYAHGSTYKTATHRYFRESLWNELFMRYMGAKSLADQVLAGLDGTVSVPDVAHF